MLKYLQVLIRFFLFWILIFFIDRLIFVFYFLNKFKDSSASDFLMIFYKGLRIDASTAMYVSALPLIVFFVLWLFRAIRFPDWVLKYYAYIIITIISFIGIVNFNVYREWGSKINYRILDFTFDSPKEALASSGSSPILTSFVIFFIQLIIGIWLSRKILQFRMPKEIVPLWQKIPVILLLILGAGLVVRGGWQLSPINQSMAYFSDKPILNHAAINTEWNLIHDVINNKYAQNNPYQYLPEKEAAQKVKELYSKETQTTNILTTHRPNVVMIILESFTGNIVESLGGEKGVAPKLESLIKDGLFFTDVYASGDRTDRGVVAVLSGFPSQAIRSIMKQNDKQEKLPAIPASLDSVGYHTSFYYGGESEFFNLKSYILSHHYKSLTDKRSFAAKDMNSKWGAFDHVVYQKLISEQAKTPEPFFSTILTLTNHEPFELPGNHKFGTETVEDQFRSTAYYTDSVLYNFLEKAKKQPWYQNTLFIIVADHGHRLPTNQYESFHPYRNRIPLLFFGEVIRPEFRGQKVGKTGSQTDIATTLLNQLQIPHQGYRWGKDLLDPTSSDFAFFSWDNGFGVITPEQSISFDNVGKKVIYKQHQNHPQDQKLLETGKAYMQQVFNQYVNY